MAQRKDENGALYDYPEALGPTQVVAVGAASVQSAALQTTTALVVLTATTDCWVAVASNPTAAAAAGSFFLPAKFPMSFSINKQLTTKIAVIQASAAGSLSILEAA